MEISRPDGASNIADLGLTLSEAKQLLARVQQAIVAAQAEDLLNPAPKIVEFLVGPEESGR
jgi:hypothetical protein